MHPFGQDESVSSSPREEDMETMHVYIYQEAPKESPRGWRERCVARTVQIFALGMLSALCLIPPTTFYATRVLRVPAHFLPMRVLRVQQPIVPTGTVEHLATQAHGLLTIYNGSFVLQQLPSGFILTTKDGTEIMTDQEVTVPAANPPLLGMATVPAHGVVAGEQGNIAAYAINQTYGSSISIKNLTAFTGGHHASTTLVVTKEDMGRALDAAREQLVEQEPVGLLDHPCTEQMTSHDAILFVTWSCQFVSYTVPPNVQVLSAHVVGNTVILAVRVKVQFE